MAGAVRTAINLLPAAPRTNGRASVFPDTVFAGPVFAGPVFAGPVFPGPV